MFRQFRESDRLPAVDLMKLYASFLVILGHCVSHFVLDFDGPLYNAIWLTQMPLFFFASGLIAPTREKLDTFDKFGTRVLKNALALQWLLSFGCAFLLVLMVAATCLVLHFLPYANLVLFGKSRSHYAFEKRLPAILR